jgi:hypothetical protein
MPIVKETAIKNKGNLFIIILVIKKRAATQLSQPFKQSFLP